MKTLIATATKHSLSNFKNTRLAKSLTYHKPRQTNVSYSIQPTYENTDGLCSVYNTYLTKENLNTYDCILFCVGLKMEDRENLFKSDIINRK